MVMKMGRVRQLLPTAGSAGDAFIPVILPLPPHEFSLGAVASMMMGILVPLLLVRASQLLDPVPVLAKSTGLTAYKRSASGCCWRPKRGSQRFGNLLQVACPWAAEPDLNTAVSDPMVYCTLAL